MRRHTLVGMVCALIGAGVANGQGNAITCWWTDAPGNIIISQGPRSVRITGPGSFKMDAVTTGGLGGLGTIDKIYTDPNINGTVRIFVHRDPNAGGDPNQPGAAQVKEIDLTGATTGELVILRCTSHLGANADVRASTISEAFVVGGNVINDVAVSGAIECPVQINGYLRAGLSCASLQALTVSGVGIAPATPSNYISIDGGYGATMNVNQTLKTLTIRGDVEPGAGITINQLGSGAGSALLVTGDIHGSVTLGSVSADFQIGGGIKSAGALTVNQNFATASFDDAVIGAVAPGGTVTLGALAGNLGFAGAMAGTLSVVEELSGTLEVGTTGTGSVQIGTLSGQVHAVGELDGTLTVGTVPSGGEISAGGTISAAIQVETDMAGTISTGATSDLSGSVAVLEDLTGEILIGRDLLHNPPHWSDPNRPLTTGNIIINGNFQGTTEDPARILIGRGMAGPEPFIAVDYSGYSGATWDANTAYVAIGDPDPHIIIGNEPAASVWHIRGCRGDLGNVGAATWASADGFVEAMKTPWTYAHHYPGLGALQAPWGSGGSRGWHVDADASGQEEDVDFNAFVIRLVDPNDPACYATWPGSEPNDVPAQLAADTAWQLLANVDVSRWSGLLEIETGLTEDSLPIEIKNYWQAVRDYQTTPHAGPPALDFGGDFDPNQQMTFTLNCAGCGERSFSIQPQLDANNPLDPNWLSVSRANGTFTDQQIITVTLLRRLWTVGYHDEAELVMTIDNEDSFEIPVTFNKPLTTPPITACLEIGGYPPDDPNIVAGLAQWQRVTDTACIEYSDPSNVMDPNAAFASWHAALVQQTGRDMRIFGMVKANRSGCVLDSNEPWQDVAAAVNDMVAWTGDSTVFLDTEKFVRKYTDDPAHQGEPGNVYECGPNDFNLTAFGNAVVAFHEALDPNLNITILWYRGVSWGACNAQNYPTWELEWTKSLLGEVCPAVHPRIVSLTYDGESCLNHICALDARDWEDANCVSPTRPMFPIIYIGDPNDRLNETPEELGDYWTWEQANQVLAELAGDGRSDAIFYPGHADWLLTGQSVADVLWNQDQ